MRFIINILAIGLFLRVVVVSYRSVTAVDRVIVLNVGNPPSFLR